MDIRVETWPHAELHYFVLSHLDLGANAANLYRPDRREKPWRDELEALYHRAPGRLYLQVIPLFIDDLQTELDWLRDGDLRALGDPESLEAARFLADVLEREASAQAWRPRRRRPLDAEFEAQLSVLTQLRRKLWDSAQREPPPLSVIDCPALTCGRFTHGRGAPLRESHRVAVSLDVHPVDALIQVFHEEIHPVSDPPIRARFDGVDQATEVHSRGHQLHAALEERAIELGRELVDAHAPASWRRAYRRWCGRYR